MLAVECTSTFILLSPSFILVLFRPSVGFPLSFSISIVSSVYHYCIPAAWHAHLIFPDNSNNNRTMWESSSSSLRVEFVNPFCPKTSSRITNNSFSLEQVTSLLQNPRSWRTRIIIRRVLPVGCLPWLTSPLPSCNSGKGVARWPLSAARRSSYRPWKMYLKTKFTIALIQYIRQAKTVP